MLLFHRSVSIGEKAEPSTAFANSFVAIEINSCCLEEEDGPGHCARFACLKIRHYIVFLVNDATIPD